MLSSVFKPFRPAIVAFEVAAMLLVARVEPELKNLLQKLADVENHNLSNFVVNAVISYL